MTTHPRNHDLDGFIHAVKTKKSLDVFVHNFYFPKDVISNIFDFQVQEERKAMYLFFNKMVEKIKRTNSKYNPLPNIQ